MNDLRSRNECITLVESEMAAPPAAQSSGGGLITHHVSRSGYGARYREPEDIRAAIYAVEGLISQVSDRELIPAEHMFVPGLYFRKFEMEADTWLTGKLHAQDDGLIVAEGKVTFHTENESVTMKGPVMTTVKANTKPLLYAHTHVVFFSAHLNLDNTRDMAVIESRVVTPNEVGCQPVEVLQ